MTQDTVRRQAIAIARFDMLLGSAVGVFAVIPVLGALVAGLWGLAIMMVTFETIHRIRRIHAFLISFGIGLLIQAVGLA